MKLLLAVHKDTRSTIYVVILSVTPGPENEFRPITRPDSESRLHRLRPCRLGTWWCETDQLSHKAKSLPLPHGGVEVCCLPSLSLQFHADQCQFWIWRRRKEAIYCHSKQIACREAENGVGEKTRKRNACIAITSADKEICAVLVHNWLQGTMRDD